MAELLLAAGADVKAANDLGATPLWLACLNGSMRMAERLLNAGADANAALKTGETPLMTAARSGRSDIVKVLVAHRANVNATEALRGQTALMWASAQQHPDVVKTLLEVGASVGARSRARRQLVNTSNNADYSGVIEVEQGGYTPLLFAARMGDVDSGRILLENGADLNDKAPLGTSALVIAAHSGHRAFAELLLEKGADPNAMDAGYGALHIAVQRGDTELVKSLLARGADPNAYILRGSPTRRVSADITISSYSIGATPLWLAASQGRADLVRLLAAKGASVRTGQGRHAGRGRGRGRGHQRTAQPRDHQGAPRVGRRRRRTRQGRQHGAACGGVSWLRDHRPGAGRRGRQPEGQEPPGPDASRLWPERAVTDDVPGWPDRPDAGAGRPSKTRSFRVDAPPESHKLRRAESGGISGELILCLESESRLDP